MDTKETPTEQMGGTAAPDVAVIHPAMSDLARRISLRREELGLSLEEVARRAELDVGYLTYVEQNPAAVLSTATLVHLAKALETTTSSLAGGDASRTPGSGRGGAPPRPRLLDPRAVRAASALGRRRTGRLRQRAAGPVAQPVNFRFDLDRIVFRTEETAQVLRAMGSVVGFEVDRIDDAWSEGWSVLVTGRAERIDSDRALARLRVEPWAGGVRDVFVQIDIEQISGRAIRQAR